MKSGVAFHLCLAVLATSLAPLPLTGQEAPAPPEKSESQMAFEKAEELYRQGNYEEAVKGFTEFAEKYTFSKLAASAISFKGWSLLNLQKHEEAAAAFDEVRTKWPKSPMATARSSR